MAAVTVRSIQCAVPLQNLVILLTSCRLSVKGTLQTAVDQHLHERGQMQPNLKPSFFMVFA